MVLTEILLANIAQCPVIRAMIWVESINLALERFEINTAARIGAFITQASFASDRFQHTIEEWNPNVYLWQAQYEGNTDIGNTEPGDGRLFIGRGLLPSGMRGRLNYQQFGESVGEDIVSNPSIVESRKYAALAAGWVWHSRGCNTLADIGEFKRTII